MCARYSSQLSKRQLERLDILVEEHIAFESYNIAPSDEVPIVRALNGRRELTLARWGLIPHWAKGEPIKGSTINARAERMKEAPAYRSAWRRGQRCLFPALGFYEWQAVDGEKTKQPWFIKSKGDDLLVMAGLWDRSGDTESATMITVDANELMTEIHRPKNRMPLILTEGQWSDWLAGDDPDSLVQTLPDGLLEAWPVSTYVNKPANNDVKCIAAAAMNRSIQGTLF